MAEDTRNNVLAKARSVRAMASVSARMAPVKATGAMAEEARRRTLLAASSISLAPAKCADTVSDVGEVRDYAERFLHQGEQRIGIAQDVIDADRRWQRRNELID